MCKITAACLFLLAVISTAQAEEMALPTVAQCDSDPEKIFKVVEEQYNEVAFIEGNGGVISVNGQYMISEFKMYLNPESKSFSVIIIDPITGVACLYFAGNNLIPSVTGDDI